MANPYGRCRAYVGWERGPITDPGLAHVRSIRTPGADGLLGTAVQSIPIRAGSG